MALREDGIGQTWLVPRRLVSFIPDNHLCFFITNLVEGLDFKKNERKYKYTKGKPAYSRHMLTRLVIMASVDGIFSSRKIMKLAEENMVYMYVSGMDKPDFRTICRFKIECAEQIQEAFEMTIKVANKAKIVQLNHIAIDGTKIKANASSSNLINQEEIQTIRSLLKKGIETDEEEDKIYGDKRGDEMPPELKSKKRVKELIESVRKENSDTKNETKLRKTSEKLLKQASQSPEQKELVFKKLEKAENELKKTKQKTVSLTDPESRWMINKKNRIELSYNMQIAVDYNSGIILANSVTQDPTDHHQLIPQIEQTIDTIGPLLDNTAISADNGYFTKTNLQYLDNNKLDGYIPNRKQAHESKRYLKPHNIYSKHNFTYNYENDFYLCPNNEKLEYKKTYNYNNVTMRQYYTNKCLNCSNQLECTGKDRFRIITDYGDVLSKRMALKMESENGKIEFAKRKMTVEWPFGNIKQNLKYTEYLTRGIQQTQTENNLICISHNIKRIHKHQTQQNQQNTPTNLINT